MFMCLFVCIFFFKQKTAYEMRISDWSSDVCSSDLTVQVIPHVTNEIKDFARADVDDLDFLICEIGGTVGDIESLPFMEAIRQLRNDLGTDESGRKNTVSIHTTLVPYIAAAGELRTKPTQHREIVRAHVRTPAPNPTH